MSQFMKSYGFILSFVFLGWGLLTWGLFVIVTAGTTGGGAAGAAAGAAGLTAFQLDYGIGPITEPITFAPLDETLAKKGEAVFDLKCYACHRLDKRLVGPPLGDILKRRKPEFVLNMMLNPDEMQKRHPVVQKLLAEYMTAMTFQNVTLEDGMAIIDYIRQYEATTDSTTAQ